MASSGSWPAPCDSGQSHSFVLKVWPDPDTDRVPEEAWRGRITHLPSNAELHFTEVEKAFTFIRSQLSISRPSGRCSGWVRYRLRQLCGAGPKRASPT